jgi:SAM-dependent methyltransferase
MTREQPAVAPLPDAEAPSAWIVRFASLVPRNGHVLDVACGRGRHSVLFAARDCAVTAVDRDAQALTELAGVANVTTLVCDLEAAAWPFDPGRRFDAIVVTRYLHRPLFGQLLRSLADDGVLLYETFAAGNEAYGRPSRPEFLLDENELLAIAPDRLTLIAFEQGLVEGPKPAVLQRLAAVGRGRPWPPALPA